MNLKIRKKLEKGYVSVIEEKEGIKLIHLGILKLKKEEKFDGSALNDRETALVILSGNCDIFCGSEHFLKIGDRRTVFEGPATALYVPAGSEYHPVVAAPGYKLYYLWVLAGDKRIMRMREDSQHRWVRGKALKSLAF